jgi:hypothetical protein
MSPMCVKHPAYLILLVLILLLNKNISIFTIASTKIAYPSRI